VAKKKRSAKGGPATRQRAGVAPREAAAAGAGPRLPEWRWRTFPVFFAFVAGVLLASLINPPNSDFGYAVQIAALAGFGYGIAHLFVVNVIVAGRLKRRRQAIERGETPPEDFEEELVYKDEEPAPRT
jgi:hypothetical protein